MAELSNFKAYAVTDETGKVVSVTDTFAQAIEAAEAHATQVAQTEDNSTETLSILAMDTEAKPSKQGYYGRWKKYDEKEGNAELQLFFLRVKADGYVFAGSIRERHVINVKVQPTIVDLFEGYMVPYDVEVFDVPNKENTAAASDDELDEGSDDETYKPE